MTSNGLWKLRADLRQLFPKTDIVPGWLAEVRKPDGYIGWGNKPSGVTARRLAARKSKESIFLEGGFLHGFFPGTTEPQASYILDRTGVHYDSIRPSDLEKAISTGIVDPNLLNRAQVAIDELRSKRLSKYNCAPLLTLTEIGIDASRPFVLLIDQVPNDASIAGAQADAGSFELMLKDAIRIWSDCQIVVRPHLASKQTGHLVRAAREFPSVKILQRQCNIWPLLEEAEHVYTVSSHVGFEALFCGTPVTCFGYPFYAGWGLTNDVLSPDLVPNRGANRSLQSVFAAAYLQCSRYLDLHDRTPTTLENSIDALSVIVKSRSRNRSMVATAGMTLWKRKAVAPFLISSGGKPRHFSSIENAKEAAKADGVVAVWGETSTVRRKNDPPVYRLEDGFLRSSGLGAALRFPLSLVRDTSDHLYYDARGPGMIDSYLATRPFSDELLARSSSVITEIVSQRLTKYQLGQSGDERAFKNELTPSGALKILVTGQVEDDASIRLSTSNVNTNTGLLQAVRDLYPAAVIAYREHPDVARNLRPGKADRSFADLNADNESLPLLLDWCDRLETLTSLTGFEALLRNKSVGVHGWPFYAGWGLTDDRLDREPRGVVTLEELVAATLLLYPDYIHPQSQLPCTPERMIAALASPEPDRLLYRAALHPLGEMAGRLKHYLKKGRRSS